MEGAIALRFKLAIFDIIVECSGRYENDDTKAVIHAIPISQLLSEMYDRGWKGIGGLGYFQHEVERAGFRTIQGKPWRYKPDGDWRKNGRALAKYQTIVTLKDQNDPLQFERPLFRVVEWNHKLGYDPLGKKPRNHKRAGKIMHWLRKRNEKKIQDAYDRGLGGEESCNLSRSFSLRRVNAPPEREVSVASLQPRSF